MTKKKLSISIDRAFWFAAVRSARGRPFSRVVAEALKASLTGLREISPAQVRQDDGPRT